MSAMKIFRFIVPVLLLLPACQQQENPVPTEPDPPVAPTPQLVVHTLHASTPGEDASRTRTQLDVMDDKKVLWTPHEKIAILSGHDIW